MAELESTWATAMNNPIILYLRKLRPRCLPKFTELISGSAEDSISPH